MMACVCVNNRQIAASHFDTFEYINEAISVSERVMSWTHIVREIVDFIGND